MGVDKTQEQPKVTVDDITKPHVDEGNSLAGELTKLQATEAAEKAEVDNYVKGVQNARANKTSVFGSLVEKRKPTYDENKEKRMRNAAIIQSLGDVLTAAVKGVHAYGKRGAGVVPKGAPSNAMEGVAKINDMQKKYLEQRKAWEGLELSWAQQKADDEIAAAEALLARGERNYADAKRNREKAEARIEANNAKIRDIKAANAQKEKDDADDYADFVRRSEYTRTHPSYSTRGGGGGKTPEPNYDLGRLLYKLDPQYYDSGIKKSFDALSAGEKKSYEEAAGDSNEMALLGELVREGMSQDEAIRLIIEYKDKGLDYETLMGDYVDIYGGTGLKDIMEETIKVAEDYYFR